MKHLIISVLLLLSSTTLVLGHEWYSEACCGGKDCHPIASCDEITKDTNGYLHWKDKDGQEFIFDSRAEHPSQDNQCHVCVHDYGHSKYGFCIYTLQSY